MTEVVEEIGQAWGRPAAVVDIPAYRPALPMREISSSQLAIDILGAANVANTIGQSISLTDDISRSKAVISRIDSYVKTTLLTATKHAATLAEKSGYAVVKQALSDLPALLKFIMYNTRDQTVQSAGGYRITSTFLGQETKLYSLFNQVDLLNYVLFSLPERVSRLKAERFWNTTLAPNYPSEKDMLILIKTGHMNPETLIDRYRQDHALSEVWAKQVLDIRLQQIGKPSIRDAYYMVKKGFKKEKFFMDIATLGEGWSKSDAEMLFKYFDRDPSLREIMTLNDLMPLEPAWMEAKLDAIGLSPYDKSVYKVAMEKRVVRDEITRIWALLLDNYQWGFFGKTEITDLLTSWKFSKPEIEMRIQLGELSKLKLRVKLLRDAEIYLYRKDKTNEVQCLNRLTAMGISRDIGNAIVRNEAAKRGIDWEIEEDDMRRLYISVNNPDFGDTNPPIGNYYYPIGKKVQINGNPIGEHYVGYWLLDDEVYGVGETFITVEMKIHHTVQCMFDASPP